MRFRSTPFCGSRSEEHTSELQSRLHLVCRLLLEKKKKLRPRLYPLAWSLRLYPDQVRLIAHVVRYESHGHVRNGGCARLSSDLRDNLTVPLSCRPRLCRRDGPARRCSAHHTRAGLGRSNGRGSLCVGGQPDHRDPILFCRLCGLLPPCCVIFFFLIIRAPPNSPLFPHTPLFR